MCECEKAANYELLRGGAVGGSAHVFTRHNEKEIPRIKYHFYGDEYKLTKNSKGCNVIACVKDMEVVNEKQFDQKWIVKILKNVLKRKMFRFTQFDSDVPDQFQDKICEMASLLAVQEIFHFDIPEEMKISKDKNFFKKSQSNKIFSRYYDRKKDPSVQFCGQVVRGTWLEAYSSSSIY